MSIVNTHECSKAGERVSKTCWVGSIPTVCANMILNFYNYKLNEMISYIGGKYRMAKWIAESVPSDIELYAEIFGGAFWTYLRSDIVDRPNLKEVHYNDFNRFMSNLMGCCRHTKEFINIINDSNVVSQDTKSFDKFKNEILDIENSDRIKDIKIPDYELGYKYVYLLTQVFSGTGIKPGTKMQDLRGKYKSKFDSFVDRISDPEITRRWERVTDVHNLDFEDAVGALDGDKSFLYFDPPYYSTEKYYSFHNFGLKDHERLTSTIKSMKGYFGLSYYVFDDLIKWFPKVETEGRNEDDIIAQLNGGKYIWVEKDFAKTASAKKGVAQNKGTELLILNYFTTKTGDVVKTLLT